MKWQIIHTDKEGNEYWAWRDSFNYLYIRILYRKIFTEDDLLEAKKEKVILKSDDPYGNIYAYLSGNHSEYVYLLRYQRAILYNDGAVIEYRVVVKIMHKQKEGYF